MIKNDKCIGLYIYTNVESIVKVFERADVDPNKFGITTMKNTKRSTRTYGKVLGYRNGVAGE
jgi:hypothetical protein